MGSAKMCSGKMMRYRVIVDDKATIKAEKSRLVK